MALTSEDLLAISEIMDTKLKTELQPLKNDMQELKSDVGVLKDDVGVLKDDVQELKGDVEVLKSDVGVLKDDMQDMKGDMQGMKDELHLMKLYQENMITPRLNTIESCYTDTYHRYQDDADKMEEALEDIDLLKKVVAEHSEQLQKLA